jgi:hypothetical protein
MPGAGQDYYRRKRAAGKTHLEAMRCLKRRISDVIYRCLVADQTAMSPGGQTGASLQSSAAGPNPHGQHLGGVTSRAHGRPYARHHRRVLTQRGTVLVRFRGLIWRRGMSSVVRSQNESANMIRCAITSMTWQTMS